MSAAAPRVRRPHRRLRRVARRARLSARSRAGEVLCVLGRNGVGKSTLMKLLFGQLPCRAGSVRLEGRAIEALEPAARRALGISYCPQERPVFDDLSVRDNLTLMRADRRLGAVRAAISRASRSWRGASPSTPARCRAARRRSSPSCAASPKTQPLLLLDEPSEGVQWENILHMAALIAEKKAAGAAFIVVEQNLAFAERIADRYLVIDQGRTVLEGSRSEIERERLLEHLHV